MDILNKLSQLQKAIPKGIYCYDAHGICPFWESRIIIEDGEKCTTGYCYYLQEEDCTLLWDQCKVCGINEDMEGEIDVCSK